MKAIDVFYNDEVVRQVHPYVFGYHPKFSQEGLSFEEFILKFREREFKSAKAYALRRLSKQSMLSTALAQALREYLVSQEVIDLIVEDFFRLGFLNDEEWTSNYVRGKLAQKKGPRDIACNLSRKGLPREQIEEVLGSLSDEQQEASIQALLVSRYRNRDLSNHKEKQKVIRSLIGRGFDFSIILDQLNRVVFTIDES